MKYGLLGHPLAHSFSKNYFEKKFRELGLAHSYENLDLASLGDLKKQVEDQGLNGFNVTSPYKEEIVHYLDGISSDAASINAVNTVKIVEGKWLGYNTDILGFRDSISPVLKASTKALIFGSGGSSKAVQFCLHQLGIRYQVVSRQAKRWNYEALSTADIQHHHLLINTTPLGQYPQIDECIKIPYQGIEKSHLVFDLVYNPEQSLFLKKASEQGARTFNGLQMLKAQAEYSWSIWKA